MSRVVALDGEASLMSLSEMMPSIFPPSSTTGIRLMFLSFMTLEAFIMERSGVMVMTSVVIQLAISI